MDALVELLLFCIWLALEVYVALRFALDAAFVQGVQGFFDLVGPMLDEIATRVLIAGAFLLALAVAVVVTIVRALRRAARRPVARDPVAVAGLVE